MLRYAFVKPQSTLQHTYAGAIGTGTMVALEVDLIFIDCRVSWGFYLCAQVYSKKLQASACSLKH